MKMMLLGGFALMLAFSTAQARIGETDEQLNKRYGLPSHLQPLPDDQFIIAYMFKFNGFEITAFVVDGRCQSEAYRKADHSDIDLAETLALLDANGGGARWQANEPSAAEATFFAGDMIARYDRIGHNLIVTKSAFEKRLLAVSEAKKRKELGGF